MKWILVFAIALFACGGAPKNGDVPMPTGPGTQRSLELSEAASDSADAGPRPAEGLSTPAIVEKVLRDEHRD